MASILLEIVTPEGSKLREQVDELTAPSISGEFGVLPGHLPILAAVKTGILTWRKGGETGACAIGWGFIEVSGDHAYVLTDRFVRKEDVDPVRVRAELKTLDDKIDHFPGSPTSPEYQQLVGEEVWAAVQLELYGDPPPPTVAFVTAYGAAPDQGEDGPDVNAPAPGLLESDEKLASPFESNAPAALRPVRSASGGVVFLSAPCQRAEQVRRRKLSESPIQPRPPLALSAASPLGAPFVMLTSQGAALVLGIIRLAARSASPSGANGSTRPLPSFAIRRQRLGKPSAKPCHWEKQAFAGPRCRMAIRRAGPKRPSLSDRDPARTPWRSPRPPDGDPARRPAKASCAGSPYGAPPSPRPPLPIATLSAPLTQPSRSDAHPSAQAAPGSRLR